MDDRGTIRSDVTPTNETPRPMQMQLNTTLDYSPVEPMSFDSPDSLHRHHQAPTSGGLIQGGRDEYQMQATYTPGDDFDFGTQVSEPARGSTAMSYLDYRPVSPTLGLHTVGNGGEGGGGGGGGLRVANHSRQESDDWKKDALRSMSFR